jgi:putative tryptophan/tyrosine transport system substrate-binding protein
MIADLVGRQVTVIAVNTPAARIAKQAAPNVPIVFFTGEDPVTSGLVKSLSRPAGNATGVTSMFGGLAAKQFGLLRELAASEPTVLVCRILRHQNESCPGAKKSTASCPDAVGEVSGGSGVRPD